MLQKLKNSFLRALLKCHDLLFFTKNSAPVPTHILIVSTTALGDTLWATPFVHSLKASFPKAHLSLLTSPVGNLVCKNNPLLEEIFAINTPWWRLLFLLRKKKFDTVFILHASQRSVYPLIYMTQAQTIVGSKGMNKDLDWMLTLACDPEGKHQIQRRLDMITAVGGRITQSAMDLYLSAEEKEKARLFLESKGLFNMPLIGIHPGSSHPATQWPKEHYKQLVAMLTRQYRGKIIVTGNSKEKDLVDFVSANNPDVLSLTGELDLRTLAATMAHFSVFITNDTGPLHLATALKVPTIGLFASSHYSITGPYEVETTHVIQKDKTCLPCLKKRCREPFCLLQISPQEVFNKVQELLSTTQH